MAVTTSFKAEKSSDKKSMMEPKDLDPETLLTLEHEIRSEKYKVKNKTLIISPS